MLNVEVARSHIVVELHHNPSSGASLLLDAETLALRASLKGLGLKPLAGGEVLYSANLRHFAPTHQERLIVYNPRDRTEQELFPGSTQSTVAMNYRRLVAETYAALAPEKKKELSSVYGPVDDFDRSIGPVIESKDGRRIAFSVRYESDRLIDTLRGVLAIARCERATARRWTCAEYALDQAEKRSGMKVRRGADGYYERADLDQVVARIIELR